MISANDIRVGNWVAHSGSNKPKRITVEDFWSHYDNQDKKDRFYYYDYIPLTPEILGKAGFVKDRYGCWSTDSITLDVLTDSTLWYYVTEEKRIAIISLHQLQNLYFALTGQELQINL